MKLSVCVAMVVLCLSVVECKPAAEEEKHHHQVCKVIKNGEVQVERECQNGECNSEGVTFENKDGDTVEMFRCTEPLKEERRRRQEIEFEDEQEEKRRREEESGEDEDDDEEAEEEEEMEDEEKEQGPARIQEQTQDKLGEKTGDLQEQENQYLLQHKHDHKNDE